MTRERMDYDVVVVGGGPSGLATAIHLKKKLKEAGKDAMVCLLEKASEVGAHAFSGAVMDPRGIDKLIDGWRDEMPANCVPVSEDSVKMLTKGGSLPVWPTPPPLNNHGNFVISLSSLCRYMGTKAEAAGVDVFPGFAASDLIYKELEDGTVAVDGVRVGDMGIGHDGKPRSNYTPGMDIGAKLVVLAEGSRGHLGKQASARFGLTDGKNPQAYSIGFKEIWKIPEGRLKPGAVIHTIGYPADNETFSGGFMYMMENDLLAVGFVVGLDYKDPTLDPYHLFQLYKQHPVVKNLIEGGKVEQYGAKTISEGGYWSMPKLHAPGLLLVGETAGFLNPERLKGVHLAMESGMMAADTAFDCLEKDDFSESALSAYAEAFSKSPAHKELWKSRNFRAGWEGGFWSGLITNGMRMVLGGKIFANRIEVHHDDHEATRTLKQQGDKTGARAKYDGELTFDRLTTLYSSNTKHEEDQPAHLVIADTEVCNTQCKEEYGNPCQYFCPAAVYEMVDKEGEGNTQIQVNFSNCVHCKTCDIKDPYQIINWVPPEGGGGPGYQVT